MLTLASADAPMDYFNHPHKFVGLPAGVLLIALLLWRAWAAGGALFRWGAALAAIGVALGLIGENDHPLEGAGALAGFCIALAAVLGIICTAFFLIRSRISRSHALRRVALAAAAIALAALFVFFEL